MECLFCDRDRLNPITVFEDEIVVAFMDIDPINEGHILIMPQRHYLDVDEIPDEVLMHLTLISKRIVAALKKTYNPDGYSIMQNGGVFNDVGHYHMHIFPRYKDDGFSWNFVEDTACVNVEIANRIKEHIK